MIFYLRNTFTVCPEATINHCPLSCPHHYNCLDRKPCQRIFSPSANLIDDSWPFHLVTMRAHLAHKPGVIQSNRDHRLTASLHVKFDDIVGDCFNAIVMNYRKNAVQPNREPCGRWSNWISSVLRDHRHRRERI